MCVNTKIFCRKIKGMYFGGLKVLKSRNRKLSEKVVIQSSGLAFLGFR